MELTSEVVERAIREGYEVSWDSALFSETFREPIRSRGCMTSHELQAVGRWKAVRATGRMKKASDADVRLVTAAAFSQSDPGLANWTLRYLSGVGAPMASAVLTVFDDARYTVIDVRAMATLRSIDLASLGMAGPDWLKMKYASESSSIYGEYVALCQQLAQKMGVSLRDLDRALWALNGSAAVV
jgi:hypothetical protein